MRYMLLKTSIWLELHLDWVTLAILLYYQFQSKGMFEVLSDVANVSKSIIRIEQFEKGSQKVHFWKLVIRSNYQFQVRSIFEIEFL